MKPKLKPNIEGLSVHLQLNVSEMKVSVRLIVVVVVQILVVVVTPISPSARRMRPKIVAP